jgi:branched-chain amino acid transport system ATP-binding protein/urea transport system ATP-binding protein
MALLEVAGITRRFGALVALTGVGLIVEAGQIHGLIGPNGSGKSTLMKCIAGALVPDAGTVRFAGRDITRDPPAERARAGLSMKFQITSVLPALSVYDNVLLAQQGRDSLRALLRSATRRARHDAVVAALEQFRLLGRADEMAGTLSHGEQQWLEIAMALASNPTLLLLDEPTGGMSLEERRLTGELLVPIKSRCAILLVEHDLDFIRDVSDVLTVLDQGSVLDSGSVEAIQASRKVQEVYLTRV